MPLYEYFCYGCGDRSEVVESYEERQKDHFCTKCEHTGPLKRLFPDSFSVKYNCGGFHNTDYNKSERK